MTQQPDEREQFRVLLRRSAWALRATAVLLVVSGVANGADWTAAWPWFLGALLLVVASFVVANLGRADDT